MIKINLDDTYEPHYVHDDLTEFIFNSELKDGKITDLHVKFYDI